MPKPYLILVTGRPGAGKTTFANALARACYLPLLSRDAIKEGYVHTCGKPSDELPPDANLIATNAFFDAIDRFLNSEISLIAEAAFQHPLWEARLAPFRDRALIRCCICLPGDEATAHDRYLRRGLADPHREYFHGDKGVALARQGVIPQALTPYEAPHLDVPTFPVDTTDGYRPTIEQLIPRLLSR